MFIVILGAVLGLMHLYVWKRLIHDTTSGRTRRRLGVMLLGVLVLLMTTLLAPRLLGWREPSWLAWSGYVWFGLVVYLFLALLVLEPFRILMRGWVRRTPAQPADADERRAVSRRVFLARTGAVTAGVASVALVGAGMSSALGPPDLLRVPVRLRRLDPAFAGYRIAVVSDIHLGPLAGRAHTERIVAMINGAEPDLIAIVGDLVDGTVEELGHAADPLRDLVSRDGAFFVTGNHEYFVDDTAAWLRELERLDVHPLRNENTAIRRGAAAFDLVGVNDVAGHQRSDAPDFDRAFSGVADVRPTILLAHQPVQVKQAVARGVDLQLSGHTHGGQMWPFHYIVRAAQPSLAGLSAVNDTQLYVTRGAGFWGPPLRVGAPPDISVITLAPEPFAGDGFRGR